MSDFFEATVFDVRHRYEPQGNVVPVLVLLREGYNIPYYCDVGVEGTTSTMVRRGDIVRVKMEQSSSNITSNNHLSIVNKNPNNNQAFNIYVNYCPYCGAELLRSHSHDIYGVCLSRTCIAQFTINIQYFLQAIGMYFLNKDKVIFNHILTRGILRDYIDIFKLNHSNIVDLDNVLINHIDIQTFLTYIGRFHGTVDLFKILVGFNIPNLTPDDINTIVCKHRYHSFKCLVLGNDFSELGMHISSKLIPFFNHWTNRASYLNLEPVITDGVRIN